MEGFYDLTILFALTYAITRRLKSVSDAGNARDSPGSLKGFCDLRSHFATCRRDLWPQNATCVSSLPGRGASCRGDAFVGSMTIGEKRESLYP
jgi:hypothetical protein